EERTGARSAERRHADPKRRRAGEWPRSRLEALRPRARRARRTVRRTVLHGRADHADLLPPDVSGEARAVAQRRLLSHCGSGRSRRIPPVPALPAGDRAGNARVAWRCGNRVPCVVALLLTVVKFACKANRGPDILLWVRSPTLLGGQSWT